MTPTPTPRAPVATATIVGRGRVGRAIAAALSAAGVAVNGPTTRGEAVPDADVILVCVPDDAIAGVVAGLGVRQGLVGHMSGAVTLEASGVGFGLHPLQTFAGGEGPDAFHGIGCAIAGRSAAAVDVARELAIRIGARPFAIDDEHRAGYHASASLASNFVVTLLAAAEQVARTAGLDGPDARALLTPLVRRTVQNWAAEGPENALTGPIARGDGVTVERQRDAIRADAPDLLPLFDALADCTRALAARSRSIA
ncbi:Rossmann-like and DUF2520 domain-containing protein [Microbacterium rhizomatis]|uniref:DUF2520 domain-containing protein n=1 Tax=Microbacterium rhizomatis TaxID=1631477 RepID=A0A5J5J0Y0_9MICO|nr:DUF2520 domain-containing protein [Microbacterium rhizomatis]KAA9108186.1 DUF2520 domain-containing protein [Microbacterium rhizomatis]